MMNVLSGNIIDQIDIYQQTNNENKLISPGEYTDLTKSRSQIQEDGDFAEGNSESDS
jgi:hypothetical protein